MSSDHQPDQSGNHDRDAREFEEAVGSQEERSLKAQREPRGILFWVGMFGLVGWSIAVPTLVGVGAGICIDDRWPSDISWTLTLLFAGLILGCLTAWHWIRKESQQKDQ